jgi:hypothetical protein
MEKRIAASGYRLKWDHTDSDAEVRDTDHDGNADLKVKFDRAALQALIPAGAISVLVTARGRLSRQAFGRQEDVQVL